MGSSPTASRSVFRATLRQPNYAKLLIGSVVAASGDRINQIALLSIVVNDMNNTAKYSADIMFWAILPAVVLGPFVVALIDRWDRQRTMVTSDVARACLVVSLPILMGWIHHHYVIYTIVFLIGTFSAFFAPCRQAILPRLVPKEMLVPSNGILSQAGNVGTLLGVSAGSLILRFCGRDSSFYVNGLTYIASALLILSLRPNRNDEVKGGERPHPVEDLRLGLQYIRATPPVFFCVVFFGLLQCLVAVFIVCFLSYGNEILRLKAIGICLLFGAMGLGMGAGAWWLARFPKMCGRFSWPMWMIMGSGAGMFFLGHCHNPWLGADALLWTGFFSVMVMVPLDTYLQKHVPDGFLGRVFAARGVLVGIGFLVSLQFSKAIIHQVGIMHTLQLVGIASALLGAGSLWAGRRLKA